MSQASGGIGAGERVSYGAKGAGFTGTTQRAYVEGGLRGKQSGFERELGLGTERE